MNAKRSYLGICSSTISAIGIILVLAVVAANYGATHKLAGFELVIVGPFAMLLWIVGLAMALVARGDHRANPFMRTGLWLSSVPLLWVFLYMAYGVVASLALH